MALGAYIMKLNWPANDNYSEWEQALNFARAVLREIRRLKAMRESA